MGGKVPVSPAQTGDTVTPAASDPPRKRRSLAWLWLLLLAGAGYGGYRIYQNLQQTKQKAAAAQARAMVPRAVPVAAVPSRSGDLPVYMRGLGTVTAFNTVVVKSRVVTGAT